MPEKKVVSALFRLLCLIEDGGLTPKTLGRKASHSMWKAVPHHTVLAHVIPHPTARK